MKSVTISALKANLSANLQLVRNGEDVLVCDRNRPIARIIPFASVDYNEQQQRLIATGVLIPAKKPFRSTSVLPKPAGRPLVSKEVMEQVWREERSHR